MNNRIKLTIVGGTVVIFVVLGAFGINKDDVIVEETPQGIFVNMSDVDFNSLRNGLAQKCIDETLFCEGCDNLAKINMMHDVFNHQVEKDGGNRTLKNVKDSPFKEVCKNMIHN